MCLRGWNRLPFSCARACVRRGSTVELTRRALLQSAGGIAATLPLHAQQPKTRRPPNVVVILADDMGYSDIGSYGSEISTPNLDRLGSQGVRFTQFYNCARCCPSRASLLSGLYPHQAGVGGMTGDQGQRGYRGSLQPSCVTSAQVLKTAGYRTAMVGKWHVGD